MNNTSLYKQKIGLVLISLPGYSETFFKNKISVLASNGFKITLFIFNPGESDLNLDCEVRTSVFFNTNFFRRVYNIFSASLKIIFRSPLRSLKLFRLDRKDGKSIDEAIKNLILSEFIIAEDLDWLHFGFGTLAVGKENLASAMNAKMAVSFRGFDLYLSPLKRINYYTLLFEKDVKYHVLSESMKHDVSLKGVDLDNIKVITPAINTTFFKKQNVSKTLQGNKEKIKILTVARLHWKKGLEYTLEAMALLKSRHFDFEYTIIGKGEELERLKFAAHQLGISDNIVFLGKQKANVVRDYMNEADIYVQYSIQEGFCNSVLEAQAMGLLCVVSDAEGLPENVRDNITGWVVPKRSPDLLAKKLKEVMKLTEKERNSIVHRAILRVQEKFNLEKQKQEFVKFYSD